MMVKTKPSFWFVLIAVVFAGCANQNNRPSFDSNLPPVLEHEKTKGSTVTINQFHQIADDIWLFKDTCNVYLVKHGNRGIAIDFGSGQWYKDLEDIGIEHLDHVFLTHHHADQCMGLQVEDSWPFVIHAPTGEQNFLDPSRLEKHAARKHYRRGCPNSYSVLSGGINQVKYDMTDNCNIFWNDQRISFAHTPGHSPNACSVIIGINSKQVIFCGDAAYESGTLWQPFHLEWDHWTGRGVLAAWEGVRRLKNIGGDLLCPSHGPVISENIQEKLELLAKRLMDFYQAKSSMSPNEKDLYVKPLKVFPGIGECISEHLYQYGRNGYALLSSTGQALVIDPQVNNINEMQKLFAEVLKDYRPVAATCSHYHLDHSNKLNYLKKEYGAKIYLHPSVDQILRDVEAAHVPWLPIESVRADHLWPESGIWKWNEYEFKVAHWPGQTWWHCVFMTEIDGKKVLFGGDCFSPNSRWNGAGFCAYNGCRFSQGYAFSAELALTFKPDIIAAGHDAYFYFSASKFEKIINWARHTEKVITSLCPSGDIEKDYYSLGTKFKKGIKEKPDPHMVSVENYLWFY